ncbi:hypothetical protein COCON_G00235810 [Conger conger]|uniref:Uncharacterized protein n=1 Tax=Conger conger TaxID=82655 RepID=A0A9Q1CTM6_CONCO|nr:hypothetical protein COCON_G00235810 [Conger conger]
MRISYCLSYVVFCTIPPFPNPKKHYYIFIFVYIYIYIIYIYIYKLSDQFIR